MPLCRKHSQLLQTSSLKTLVTPLRGCLTIGPSRDRPAWLGVTRTKLTVVVVVSSASPSNRHPLDAKIVA